MTLIDRVGVELRRRAGMAARSDKLLDEGQNDPRHWDRPFGSGLIHIGVRRTLSHQRQAEPIGAAEVVA